MLLICCAASSVAASGSVSGAAAVATTRQLRSRPATASDVLEPSALAVGGHVLPAAGPLAAAATGESVYIQERTPWFSWKLTGCHACRGAHQLSYQVEVREQASGALVADSGVRNSSALRHRFSARELALGSDTRYVFALRLRTAAAPGAAAVHAAAARAATAAFRTALLHTQEWAGAEWLGGGTSLRADFTLGAEASAIESATAYASGAGCFSLTLNGAAAAPGAWLEPSWANVPTSRMLYRAYDVAHLLRGGANALGMRTGMCKYGYLGQDCAGAHAANANCRAVTLQLRVRLAGGAVVTVNSSSTDGRWHATTDADPVRYSHLFHGEQYDARLEDTDWDRAGFLVSPRPAKVGWVPAVAYPGAAQQFGALSLAGQEPVAISETRAPHSITLLNGTGPAPANGGHGAHTVPCAHGLGATAPLGEDLLLRCPAGQTIASVPFASFGHPLGAGAGFTMACHAPASGSCYDSKHVPGCIFWADPASMTRHFVTSCGQCGSGACRTDRVLSAAKCLSYRDGPAFDCSMNTPNCSAFAPGGSGCAVDARAAVAAACVGKASCTVPVRAGAFGKLPASCSADPGGPSPASPTADFVLAVHALGCAPPPPPARWVFDFGQNMAGFASLRVQGAAGTRVTLQYAEELHADGSVNMAWCSGEGAACTCPGGNCANQTDTYTLRGGGAPETYTPLFTYHGYRYVQVSATATPPR